MKQPVLKFRFVCGLLPHTPDYDHRVRDSAEAHQPPENSNDGDGLPWSMQNRRQKQSDAEINDGRVGKRGAGLRGSWHRLLGNQRYNHELQSDQRARSRSDDDIEVVPFGEF